MGGVGKSELSRELEERFLAGDIARPAPNRTSVRIDFERHGSFDAEEVLLRLRGGLGPLLGDARAFDLALAAYWERARPGTAVEVFGRPASSWRRLAARIGLSDSVVEILDDVLDTVGTLSASRRVTQTVARGVLDWAARRGLTRACPFFERILEMKDVDTMRSYMPLLLAWDLSRARRRPAPQAVVFFDTWERVQAQPDDPLGAEDWLTRTIYLMPNVLFVLTGRRRVTWADPDGKRNLLYRGADWERLGTDAGEGEPRQHLLEVLSDEDCDDYLRKCRLRDGEPALGMEVRSAIVASAGGLPLYLDLSVALHDELVMREKPVHPGVFGGPLDELVLRVMRDMDPVERDLLRAASLVPEFDQGLLQAALPSAGRRSVSAFLERHFVQHDRAGQSSLHAALRDSVRSSEVADDRWDMDTWSETAARLLAHFSAGVERALASESPDVATLGRSFSGGMALIDEVREIPSWLLTVVERLVALARWDIVGSAALPLRVDDSLAAAVASGLRGIAAFRLATPSDARAALERALNSKELPTGARRLFQYHLAHTLRETEPAELSRSHFEALVRASPPLGHDARRSLAHLDIAQGRFTSALERLRRLPDDDRSRRFERLYLIGAVQYSNALWDDALSTHEELLQLAPDLGSPALQLRAHVYMGYAMCWEQPQLAIRHADRGIALAEELGHRRELGVLFTSRAIALGGNEHESNGEDALHRAASCFDAAGYSIGALLLSGADAFIRAIQYDHTGARAACRRIVDEGRRLKSYGWWAQPASVWSGERLAAEALDSRVAWVDGTTEAMIRWHHTLERRRSDRQINRLSLGVDR
jgi:tetratricopeptide (TPR) repeat protein